MNPTPERGRLKIWHRDRGFGWIKPDAGGKDVFLHISAVRKAVREPQTGDTVSYTPVLQNDGRLRATNATLQGVALRPPTPKTTRHRAKPVRQTASATPAQIQLILSISLITAGVFVLSFLAWPPTVKTDGSSPRSAQDTAIQDSPPAAPAIPKLNCKIKGNISWNSRRKYYHLPGMKDYDKTQIDAGKGERWFCSEADARAAGWQRAPTP